MLTNIPQIFGTFCISQQTVAVDAESEPINDIKSIRFHCISMVLLQISIQVFSRYLLTTASSLSAASSKSTTPSTATRVSKPTTPSLFSVPQPYFHQNMIKQPTTNGAKYSTVNQYKWQTTVSTLHRQPNQRIFFFSFS